MVDQLVVRNGLQGRTENARFIVRHVQVPTDAPIVVFLLVIAGDREHRVEREFELGTGETFSVRDETWAVDRVVKPDNSDDWYVVLSKVI